MQIVSKVRKLPYEREDNRESGTSPKGGDAASKVGELGSLSGMLSVDRKTGVTWGTPAPPVTTE